MTVIIRPMQADDIAPADRMFRLAFGTFIGLPNPLEFSGDATYIPHRWKIDPKAAFVAEANGEVVGSNLAIRWGSFGFFGPLTVHPDYWNQGVAQRLIEPVIDCFTQWETRLAGLFTFPASPKHHALYQKFGFRLRFLSVIMAKTIQTPAQITSENQVSQLEESQQLEFLNASCELTDSIYSGLDLTQTIQAVQDFGLGDTIALWNDRGLAGFAVCHVGVSTEAGSDTCYVKFAIAQSSFDFDHLLDLCEAFAASRGVSRLMAGVDTARDAAYQMMLARGFRTEITGVAMHRPNVEGFSRPDVFAIDDWR
jgi:predicted N-acetyltransferase YhbS